MQDTNQIMKHVIAVEGLSPAGVKSLVEFLRQYYFVSNLKSLSGNISLKLEQDGRYVFSFGMKLDPGPPYQVLLAVAADYVEVSTPKQPYTGEEALLEFSRLYDGVELMVRSFQKYSSSTRAYFIFSIPGRKTLEAPKASSAKPGGALLRRIMHGNAMNLFLFFLLVSFVFVVFLGDYTLFFLVVMQAVAMVFSDRLSLAMGSVRPTEDEPDVNIISVQLSHGAKKLLGKGRKSAIAETRRYLQDAVASGAGATEMREGILAVMEKRKIALSSEDVKIRTRQVYPAVERAAKKFRMPVPKIAVSNTPADNASAMGVSPTRATITITAGALEDLDDEQLESVIGHEIGHIKGRDPLILFGLTSLMYLGGFYLWVPVLLFLGFFYFVLAFGVMFLVGKFLETRADTESAIAIGKPEMLASALTTIGFRQLYYERYSAGTKVIDWLRFDPHPPTYFRVQRLYSMAAKGTNVRHTLLVSARDCVSGFFRALGGE